MVYLNSTVGQARVACSAETKELAMPEDEMLTLTEARELLGISKTTFAKLVREGVLVARPSRLDKRVKFVRRIDVESLKRDARHPRHRGDHFGS